jgi:hypothetical protein
MDYVNIFSFQTNMYRKCQSSKRIKEGQTEQPQISNGMKLVIWFSSLRGAVAFSCANIFPDTNGNREVIIATTTAVIVITTFVQGMFTIPVITAAKVKVGVTYSDDTDPIRGPLSPVHIEERFIYPLVIRGRELLSPTPRRSFDNSNEPPPLVLDNLPSSPVGASQSSGGGRCLFHNFP